MSSRYPLVFSAMSFLKCPILSPTGGWKDPVSGQGNFEQMPILEIPFVFKYVGKKTKQLIVWLQPEDLIENMQI